MNRTPTDSSDVPARARGRLGRSMPLLAGAVIAAAGLAFGSLTAASAAAGHGGPGSIEQQAARVRAEDVGRVDLASLHNVSSWRASGQLV